MLFLLLSSLVFSLGPAAPAAAAGHLQIGWCTTPDKLGAAKAAGFDYVELPVRTIAKMSEQEYQTFKAEHARVGLPTPVGNVFFPGDLPLTGPAIDKAAQSAYLKVALDRARELGLRVIVLGSGGARKVPPGFSPDTAFAQLVAFAKGAAKEAKERGITIAVEPLRKQETNIFNTAAEALRWVKAVNHPNFALMVDLYHLASENEDAGIIVTARKYIRHFHFANPIGRKFPVDKNEFDYVPFFNALRAIKYTGTISLEASVKDVAKDGPRSIALLRELAAAAPAPATP